MTYLQHTSSVTFIICVIAENFKTTETALSDLILLEKERLKQILRKFLQLFVILYTKGKINLEVAKVVVTF